MKCSRLYVQYANFFLFGIVVGLSLISEWHWLIKTAGVLTLVVTSIALIINYVQVHDNGLIFIDGFFVRQIRYDQIEEVLITEGMRPSVQLVATELDKSRHFIPEDMDKFVIEFRSKAPYAKLIYI